MEPNQNHWYTLNPSWARRELPFVHWGMCTSCIIPPGSFSTEDKEESENKNNDPNKNADNDADDPDDADDADDPDDDDPDEKTSVLSNTSTSAYKMNAAHSDGATLVYWHTSNTTESSFALQARKTCQLRLAGIVFDVIILGLVAALVDQTFQPGPVNPLDNSSIVAMTVALALFWVASITVVQALQKEPAPPSPSATSPTASSPSSSTATSPSCLSRFIFTLANVGVVATLIPLVYAMATSTSANQNIFRLLPGGSFIIVSLVWKIDVVLSPSTTTTKIQLFFYRTAAVLCCFSYIVGNLFVALHDREDQCSPSVLWLHAMLLILGGGTSSEDVGCLITEHSSVPKLIVAASGVCLLHVVAFTTLLKHIHGSTPPPTSGTITDGTRRRNRNQNDRRSGHRNTTGNTQTTELLTTDVAPSWLKRRRLILVVYSPSSKSNEDEIFYDLRLLLQRILMHEESYSPGCAVSLLWVEETAASMASTINATSLRGKAQQYLRQLIRAQKGGEWMNRVAFHCSTSSSSAALPNSSASSASSSSFVPNTSDLLKAGVDFASHVLLPTFSKIPSQNADDLTSLYITLVRSLSQEDTIISCEIHWSENKLVALEAGANHVICLNELQLGVMGRCVGAPGIAGKWVPAVLFDVAQCERCCEPCLFLY